MYNSPVKFILRLMNLKMIKVTGILKSLTKIRNSNKNQKFQEIEALFIKVEENQLK